MKKIIYLAAALMFSFVAVNAQDKPKKAKKEEKIEEFKTVEIRESDIRIGTEVPSYEVRQDPDPNYVYNAAEVQVVPAFSGSFQSEVQKGINPSDNGAPPSFKARAYVSFIVEKDGTLTNVQCMRDPGYGFGKEVVAAVEKVNTKWKPGLLDGGPVRVKYSIPVSISVP